MGVLRNGFGGHNGKVPAPPSADVPIIGQPFEIKGWLFNVMMICRCAAPASHLLLVTNQYPTACPGCGKGYIVQGVSAPPGGAAHFHIGMIPKAAEAVQPETPALTP